MKVPALVVATLEGPTDESCVYGERVLDRFLAASWHHVARAIRQGHAGARGGNLHHGLGMVGGRMIQALIAGRDAAGGRVVIRPVMQPAATSPSRMNHLGDESTPVGTEDRLRHLDLDLESYRLGLDP